MIAVKTPPMLAPAANDGQIGFTFGLGCGRIIRVGNFFLWPLCDFPDFCLVRDYGQTPSRQSAFSARVLRSRGCLDSGYGSLPSSLPSTTPARSIGVRYFHSRQTGRLDLEAIRMSTALASSGLVKVIHGANDGIFNVAGAFIASVRASLVDAFNIPVNAIPFVNGEFIRPDHRLQADDTLEFVFPMGSKGVGEKVWTGEEFCQFFKITTEDFQAWIAQGLKIRPCVDGTVRITETAADEFFRGRVIESPYLSTDEAAAYCNVTKDAFYGRVERKKITPLPGSAKENRFTREQCDQMMKGAQP